MLWNVYFIKAIQNNEEAIKSNMNVQDNGQNSMNIIILPTNDDMEEGPSVDNFEYFFRKIYDFSY